MATVDAQTKAVESRNGKPYTRILELDVATQRYSERHWKYQFEEAVLAVILIKPCHRATASLQDLTQYSLFNSSPKTCSFAPIKTS